MKARAKIPSISAVSWNEMIDAVSQRLPVKFARYGNTWKHPWLISPEWKSDDDFETMEKGEWIFRIKPGFVNGIEADATTRAELCNARTIERIERETGRKPEGAVPVDALLTEAARFPVGATRIIGIGSNSSGVSVSADGNINVRFEAVPEFFKQFGVGENQTEFRGSLTGGILAVDAPDPAGNEPPPILRACDVVLSIDRLRAIVELLPGNAWLDGFNYWMYLRYGRSTPPRERPRLAVMSKYTPRIDADFGEALQELTDPEEDTLKIATIYLLSPRGWPAGKPPDGTWNFFVAHDVFWNLNHAPAKIPDPPPIAPITLRTGLIAGLGEMIGNATLAPLNDFFSESLEASRAGSMAGRFWSL